MVLLLSFFKLLNQLLIDTASPGHKLASARYASQEHLVTIATRDQQ